MCFCAGNFVLGYHYCYCAHGATVGYAPIVLAFITAVLFLFKALLQNSVAISCSFWCLDDAVSQFSQGRRERRGESDKKVILPTDCNYLHRNERLGSKPGGTA